MFLFMTMNMIFIVLGMVDLSAGEDHLVSLFIVVIA